MTTDNNKELVVKLVPMYENINGEDRPCADIYIFYKGEEIFLKDTNYSCYFDGQIVRQFKDISNISEEEHEFKIVVTYNEVTKVSTAYKRYFKRNPINPNSGRLYTNSKIISRRYFPYFTAMEDQMYFTRYIRFITGYIGNYKNNIIKALENIEGFKESYICKPEPNESYWFQIYYHSKGTKDICFIFNGDNGKKFKIENACDVSKINNDIYIKLLYPMYFIKHNGKIYCSDGGRHFVKIKTSNENNFYTNYIDGVLGNYNFLKLNISSNISIDDISCYEALILSSRHEYKKYKFNKRKTKKLKILFTRYTPQCNKKYTKSIYRVPNFIDIRRRSNTGNVSDFKHYYIKKDDKGNIINIVKVNRRINNVGHDRIQTINENSLK